MLTRKVILSVLAVMTATSTFAHADGVRGEAKAQMNSTVDLRELKEADMARKKQLLDQANNLRALYIQNQQAVAKTKISLVEAQKKCLEVCTKAEIKGLVTDVQTTAGTTALTMAGLNSLRTVLSIMSDEWEQSEKGIRFFSKPLSSWGSRLMYGSGVVYIGAKVFNNFLDAKDQYTVGQINSLQNDLNQYAANLQKIQANIDVTTAALAQSIKVEQTGTVIEKTQVGYDQ